MPRINRELPAHVREYFPSTAEEARTWQPKCIYVALSRRVLCVARPRVEGTWAAYVDAVPGLKHSDEIAAVCEHGEKLREDIACQVFPFFSDVPYAR